MRTAAALLVAIAALPMGVVGWKSVDPGANYVVPAQDFNASYFYCFVEPNLIFGKNCGDNGSHGCHYSDKVPEMELIDHPPVTCANGQPTDQTEVGAGSAAASNYSAVSLEMDSDYMNAPIYIWPTQIVSAHPIQVFKPDDPVVQYISAWAQE